MLKGSSWILLTVLVSTVACGENDSIAVDGKIRLTGFQVELDDTSIPKLVLRREGGRESGREGGEEEREGGREGRREEEREGRREEEREGGRKKKRGREGWKKGE